MIIRVVIISGTLETSLHPVPPVADGAPEWNVFRLAEAESRMDIHVISPCEARQLPQLARFPAQGRYHHVVFNDFGLHLYRGILRHILPLRLIGRRVARLPDLMSWWYLRKVYPLLAQLRPDVVIINDRPQYIRYLRKLIQTGRLLLFMRSELGESRQLLSLLDGLIVNSAGMVAYTHQFVDPNETPVWRMPNTLGDDFTVPDFPPDRFTRPKKTVLFAGRVVPAKGVLELVQAFQLVLDEAPEAELVVCGAANNHKVNGVLSDYERAVRREASHLPPDKVRFEGYVPNQRMGKYYTQAYLAVFPSICKESFGMVTLEAMRCGVPVVASHRPGFEELVVPGETGILVDDPEDRRGLADAIVRILGDPHRAQHMGRAGLERSLQYVPERAVRKLEKILIDVLRGSEFTKEGHVIQ